MPDGYGGSGEGSGNQYGGDGGSSAANVARLGMGLGGTGSELAGTNNVAPSPGYGQGSSNPIMGDPNKPWGEMSDQDKAAFYAENPRWSAFTSTLQKLFGGATLGGIVQNQLVPEFVSQQRGVAEGVGYPGAENTYSSFKQDDTTQGRGGNMADASGLTGSLSTILDLVGGINSMTAGQSTGAQSAADPFAQYRSGLASTYASALAPGGSTNIEAMPGFTQYKTGVMDPALEASQRAAASTGQLYSGGEQQALQKTGQQGYYNFMTDYMNRLATGSGATQSPYNAANLGVQQQNQNQQAQMQGLGAIFQGVAGLPGLFSSIGSLFA
jgi:hypothetical protein